MNYSRKKPNDLLFRLSSRGDFRAFDTMLNSYIQSQTDLNIGVAVGLLENAFLIFKNNPDCAKLMASLFDLKLVFTFSYIDFLHQSGNRNEITKQLKINDVESSILENQRLFNLKIQQLYKQNSFVLRARSFWDKFIGFLFLHEDSNKYEKFIKAKSRKSYFKKYAGTLSSIPPAVQHRILQDLQHHKHFSKFVDDFYSGNNFQKTCIEFIYEVITDLDDSWRTQEAHGTGMLRKHTLSLANHYNSKDVELNFHCNVILHAINGLAAEFSDEPLHDFRKDTQYQKSREVLNKTLQGRKIDNQKN